MIEVEVTPVVALLIGIIFILLLVCAVAISLIIRSRGGEDAKVRDKGTALAPTDFKQQLKDSISQKESRIKDIETEAKQLKGEYVRLNTQLGEERRLLGQML